MSAVIRARRHLQTTDSPKGTSSLSLFLSRASPPPLASTIRDLVPHFPLPHLSTSASPLAFLADFTHAGKLRPGHPG